jgi:hypothetical protein
MKTIKKISVFLLIAIAFNMANAQSKNDDKSSKIEAVKTKVNSKHYTFNATYALPLRGGSRQLTYEYDLRVTPDSLIAFLPYFGRVYYDAPYGGADGGIKFTSTKFSYDVVSEKHGGWEITLQPADAKNLNRMVLDISADGYASLAVTSANRDFISFNGYLK